MDQLDQTAENIRQQFEQVNTARDAAYHQSRSLISLCARAIRAVHRDEWQAAESLIAEARAAATKLNDGVSDYPALYYAGYFKMPSKNLLKPI